MRVSFLLLTAFIAFTADHAYAQGARHVDVDTPSRSPLEVKVHLASSWLGPINGATRYGAHVPERLHHGADLGIRVGYAVRARTILFAGVSRAFMNKHRSDGYRRYELEAGGWGARPEIPIFPGTKSISSYSTNALEAGVQVPFLVDKRLTPYGELGGSILWSEFVNDAGDWATYRGIGVLLEAGFRIRIMRRLAADVSGYIGLHQYARVRLEGRAGVVQADALRRGLRLGLALSP